MLNNRVVPFDPRGIHSNVRVDTRIFICSYTHMCPYVYEGIQTLCWLGSNEGKGKSFGAYKILLKLSENEKR